MGKTYKDMDKKKARKSFYINGLRKDKQKSKREWLMSNSNNNHQTH